MQNSELRKCESGLTRFSLPASYDQNDNDSYDQQGRKENDVLQTPGLFYDPLEAFIENKPQRNINGGKQR